MQTARLIFVFGLFFRLTAGTALADDLPTFQILMKDGRLIPARLVVPANTKFRLEVRNDNPGAAEFESYDLKKELVLAPGVTRKLVFHPLQPGSYKVFDEFHLETGQGLIIAK